MSGSVVFPIVTAAACAAALIAFRAGRERTYAALKAVASLGFVGTAVATGAATAVWSSVALGALALAAVGDVVLAVPGTKRLRVGLGFFACAYLLCAAAYVVHGLSGAVLAATAGGAAFVALGAWLALRRRLPASMRLPVAAYLVVVAAMLAAGTATGISHRAWLLVAGVLLVAASDAAVGGERFANAGFRIKVVGLPAYYAGQTLIALSLVGP